MATILVAGGTGLIGSVVLETALASSRVAKVYSLQRRYLPEDHAHKRNPKLQEVVLGTPDAWTAWPANVQEQLKSVDACIWCLGITPLKCKDILDARSISVDYTTYALKALLALGASREGMPSSSSSPLRFIYISGMVAVQDQNAKLWYWSDYRKMRGQVENELIRISDSHNEGNASRKVELGITRLAGVASAKPSFFESVLVATGVISHPLRILSKQILKIALDGPEQALYLPKQVMALPVA